jgi:membrane-associated phospholipid phosphatase
MKVVLILLWPAGIAAILALTALMARGARSPAPPATTGMGRTRMNGYLVDGPVVGPRSARSSIIGLLLILVAGAVIVYMPTALLGMLVTHAGPAIDKPVYSWTVHNRVQFWASVMRRVTKAGDTWTMWGAAAAAAVCLAACYRKNKWLPPLALGLAVILDRTLGLALRYSFERPGPPASPHGTFPSGGCARIVLLSGLIAYLIWREFSGSKKLAIWAAGTVGVLGYSEAYSRGYLTLHWFTDIISGLLYGTFVLAVFIVSIRLVDGPARKAAPAVPGNRAIAAVPR